MLPTDYAIRSLADDILGRVVSDASYEGLPVPVLTDLDLAFAFCEGDYAGVDLANSLDFRDCFVDVCCHVAP